MKSPLMKRIRRELWEDKGKNLALFLFLTLTIGFVSGALVAGGSMIATYNESFDKYNIEDGNFTLEDSASDILIETLEEKDLTVYSNSYVEKTVESAKEVESTLRIFQIRTDVNLVCLMEGELPQSEDSIAIDRMYARNNGISVGDQLEVGGITLQVSGLIALPDYSALFADNGDSMFDALKFGVAVMSQDGMEAFLDGKIYYSYSWVYQTSPKDDQEKKERADEILTILASNAAVDSFVPEYANQAIHFTGDDLGGDRNLYLVLLYILIAIIGFIFGVTTADLISREAKVIGTLRASGYTRGEMVCHYLAVPMLITLGASLVGNILGYTLFKNVIANLYYGSYSLTTYQTLWNGDAFLLTTVVPFILILAVNTIMIRRKLSLSPLRLLRGDLAKHHRKKAVKLPKLGFFQRFRLRIIIQNLPGYATMFLGICFANLLLLFGLMMFPLLEHYQAEILDSQIADYQYILSRPTETSEKGAEKYAVVSLDTTFDGYDAEGVTIYGISKNSAYMTDSPKQDEIWVSDSLSEKYGVEIGDTLKLENRYEGKTYQFQITGIHNYPASLSVFMELSAFTEKFEQTEDYYNGWFSDTQIQDIDERLIQTVITEESLTKTTRQLEHSMGSVFYLFHVVSVCLYLILFYLLARVVVEKNTISISMVKILGYQNSEIRRLYLRATGVAVAVSLLLGIPLAYFAMKAIYVPMMRSAFTGWLPYYVEPAIYPEIFCLGMGAYLVIEWILNRRIRRIPMGEALKNVE